MLIIGITGPSGAGKTTVLGVLEEMGSAVIDCDAVYHRLLAEKGSLLEELRERFGEAVLDRSGALDRKALGNIVFHDPQALAGLNAITHKHVAAEVDRQIAQAKAEGRVAAAVDAIALIESGVSELCHVTVAVTAPADIRVARLMAREGVSEDYARARIAAQQPDSFYEENCTYVLVNDGGVEEFRRKAQKLFDRILHPKEDF